MYKRINEIACVAERSGMAQRPWEAWEPDEFLASRGPTDGVESEHFVARWGDQRRSFTEADALRLLDWLETAWSRLCEHTSPRFFVQPYTTPGWCDDGVRRKMNVFVTGTGLAPFPGDAAWAHQGTHVTALAQAHPLANPGRKLHHSYLALCEGAAKEEATVVHEFTHCLQMHSGGHVDSPLVGWQWEAHAELAVHWHRPADSSWAHGLDAFLSSAHLPPGCTRTEDGGGDGRQYVVWPFFAWLDRRFGAGTANGLWRADWEQRCSAEGRGRSRDSLSNLASRLGGGWPALREAFGADWALAVATAHFDADPAADAAVRGACSPLAPRRLAKLRPEPGGAEWSSDPARPLKQHGVCVHRLQAAAGAEIEAELLCDGDSASALRFALVAFDMKTGERIPSAAAACGGTARLTVPAARSFALLLAVSACPDAPLDVPWGMPPSSLPTHAYRLRLRGCAPHADSLAPPAAALPTLQPSSVAGGRLSIPTGLGNMLPCELSPGASATDVDLRSGEPGATTLVWLRHAVGGGGGRSRIASVSLAYRTVVGYSGNAQPPGPRFELVAAPLDGARRGDGSPSVSVLYSSPEFAARPYNYDAGLGGHPRNYSPAVRVVDAPCDAALPAGGLRLGIRFINGTRNVHLQGGGWPSSAPGDLELSLGLE